MTRNTISVPPLEPRESPHSAPAAPMHGRHREHRQPHPGMDAGVTEASRVGDVPDVGFRAVMERDTPVSLYVGLLIAILACVIVGMVIAALV